MKEVIDDKEPRYEETTFVPETASGEAQPSSGLSCCSKPHIYHAATSSARKACWKGLAQKTIDDLE